MIENAVSEKSPALKLCDHEKEIERMIRAYEEMFGTIVHGIHHEHHHTVVYLQGRLAGLKYAMRVMDI